MPSRPSLLLAGLLVVVARVGGQQTACTSTVTGDLRIHQLESRIFGNTRSIRVLLPPGYDDPANAGKHYPVLYLLDGQNLFDACLSPFSHHEWRVDEIVDSLIAAGRIPPLIVVGVDHAGMARGREYLPYRDPYNPDQVETHGDRLPDFIVNEVMPSVDQRYRTWRGAGHTGIGGSSYGGVAALYAILARPGDFGYALVESAWLQVGMGQLVRDTDPLTTFPERVWFGFGGHEGGSPAEAARAIQLTRLVETHFRSAGYDDQHIRVVIDPDAEHTEAAWAARLPDALTFLFGTAP